MEMELNLSVKGLIVVKKTVNLTRKSVSNGPPFPQFMGDNVVPLTTFNFVRGRVHPESAPEYSDSAKIKDKHSCRASVQRSEVSFWI